MSSNYWGRRERECFNKAGKIKHSKASQRPNELSDVTDNHQDKGMGNHDKFGFRDWGEHTNGLRRTCSEYKVNKEYR